MASLEAGGEKTEALTTPAGGVEVPDAVGECWADDVDANKLATEAFERRYGSDSLGSARWVADWGPVLVDDSESLWSGDCKATSLGVDVMSRWHSDSDLLPLDSASA